MIVCTKADKSLLDVIDNTYIRTKVELDKTIFNIRTLTTIIVENDFIYEEFVEKGISFSDYVRTIEEVNKLVTFNTKFDLRSEVFKVKNKLDEFRSERDLAMYCIANPAFTEDIKFSLKEIDSIMQENGRLKSSLMSSLNETKRAKESEEAAIEENDELSRQVIQLSSRLKSLKEADKKIHISNYNHVIYIKENEVVRHTYSLVSSLINELSIGGLTTSCMVIVPSSADLMYAKLVRRNFVDLRKPYITDLVDSRKVVVDSLIKDKIEVFLRNTVQSDVLIILDKSLSSRFMFSASSIFLVDIGRFNLKGFSHFGVIKHMDTVGMTMNDLHRYYIDNPVIKPILLEVLNV